MERKHAGACAVMHAHHQCHGSSFVSRVSGTVSFFVLPGNTGPLAVITLSRLRLAPVHPCNLTSKLRLLK